MTDDEIRSEAMRRSRANAEKAADHVKYKRPFWKSGWKTRDEAIDDLAGMSFANYRNQVIREQRALSPPAIRKEDEHGN